VIARLGSDGEVRWARVFILVQTACPYSSRGVVCYPLFDLLVVGVTNGRERERAPKSLECMRGACVCCLVLEL
jgi:hypothetical protein